MAALSNVPIAPVSAAGAAVALDDNGFATLVDATVYYCDLGDDVADARLVCAQVQSGDTTLVATITIEDCVYPSGLVTGHSATVGDWIPEDPPGAYVPTIGIGWIATGTTVEVSAGALGGCMYSVDGAGRRLRLKIDVTTGGDVRVGARAKD